MEIKREMLQNINQNIYQNIGMKLNQIEEEILKQKLHKMEII